MAITTTIRDFAPTNGQGGYAVMHVDGCHKLRRSAIEIGAGLPDGWWVEDSRHYQTDPFWAEKEFRSRWTVSVSVEVRRCDCARHYEADLTARAAADAAWAAAEDAEDWRD